jgi:hypothetical protein
MKLRNFALSMLFFMAVAGCQKSDRGAQPVITGHSLTDEDLTCVAKLSDVENLEIFPANNWWNLDISKSAVDPYSKQIIAKISAAHLKADLAAVYGTAPPLGFRSQLFAAVSRK